MSIHPADSSVLRPDGPAHQAVRQLLGQLLASAAARRAEFELRAGVRISQEGSALLEAGEAEAAEVHLLYGPGARTVGLLRVEGARHPPDVGLIDAMLQQVPALALEHWSHGAQSLCGQSPAYTQAVEKAHRAAQSDLPVLLCGGSAEELGLIAAAIHALGERRGAPFVELSAETISIGSDHLRAALHQARSGTVLLTDLSTATPEVQSLLFTALRASAAIADGPRLIGVLLAESGRTGLIAPLRRLLDIIHISLPPLSERPADVSAWATRFVDALGLCCQLDPDLILSLQAHDWPGGLGELRRCVTGLAMSAPSRCLTADDLARWLLPEEAGRRAPGVPPPPELARRIIEGAGLDGMKLHSSVRRALFLLRDRCHTPLILGDVAREVGASASHLSALFRRELGLSFKPFLNELRLAKARRLIHQDPNVRIGEVVEQVGLQDMTHFDRLFRRAENQSPREYRRQVRAVVPFTRRREEGSSFTAEEARHAR